MPNSRRTSDPTQSVANALRAGRPSIRHPLLGRPPWQRRLLQSVLEIAGLLILHQALLHYLADHNIVSTIFAAGDHVPLLTSATAVLFILVRLMTVLALPGMILARLGLVALDAVRPPPASRSNREPPCA